MQLTVDYAVTNRITRLFEPEKSMEEGLKNAIEWYRQKAIKKESG